MSGGGQWTLPVSEQIGMHMNPIFLPGLKNAQK